VRKQIAILRQVTLLLKMSDPYDGVPAQSFRTGDAALQQGHFV